MTYRIKNVNFHVNDISDSSGEVVARATGGEITVAVDEVEYKVCLGELKSDEVAGFTNAWEKMSHSKNLWEATKMAVTQREEENKLKEENV